jgi:predicted CoA-binding protein
MTRLESDNELRILLTSSRTVAVVGLSNKPGRDSFNVARYLQQHGYTIIPVNPAIPSALGEHSFPDLDSIGRPVDIVNIFRRPEHVPAIVEAAVRINARAVWMQFDVYNHEAAQRASEAGLQVVADRCIKVEHHRLVR